MSVTREKTFQLNDSKTSCTGPKIAHKRHYIVRPIYVVSSLGEKIRELPLSRREIASLRGGYVGEGKETEPTSTMPRARDEIFPKASRKAGRRKSAYLRSLNVNPARKGGTKKGTRPFFFQQRGRR